MMQKRVINAALTEIATIERAKKDKVYSCGSICIQISATKGQLKYLEENSSVDSKYAVITPNGSINERFLYYLLEKELPEFLHKYQTGLNIKPEIFEYLNLTYPIEKSTQRIVARVLDLLDEYINLTMLYLSILEEIKRYFISVMFI